MDYTFALTHRSIYVMKRILLEDTIELNRDILHCIVLEGFLILLHQDGYSVFDCQKKVIVRELVCFERVLCGIHAWNITNTLVLGTESGMLCIFDINENKMIRQTGNFKSAVSKIVQTPISGVLAIVLSSGELVLFDLNNDSSLLFFEQEYPITTVSFTTDNSPYMVTGDIQGNLSLWNLETRLIQHTICAHHGPLSTLTFIPKRPYFVTNGGDNSIKIWVIESNEIRLLKSRCGHPSSIKKIQFFSEDNHSLITTGKAGDINYISLIKDSQCVELSQGSLPDISITKDNKQSKQRLPVTRNFCFYDTKDLKWANMISCHYGLNKAYTWKIGSKRIDDICFQTKDLTEIMDVAISPCGNFVAVGSTEGNIDIFNLQSGIHRKQLKCATPQQLCSLHYNSFGSALFATCANGIFMHSTSGNSTASRKISFQQSITFSVMSKNSSLLAVAHADFSISIIDTDTCEIIRILKGHENLLTDMVFNSNQKLLFSASNDLTIRIWDLISSNCVNVYRLDKIPVSISLSQNMEFLAIALNNDVTIQIWSINNDPVENVTNNVFEPITNLIPMNDYGITLKGINARRWLEMTKFQLIKENSKPIFLQSKPLRVPFFLEENSALPVTPQPSRPITPTIEGSIDFSNYDVNFLINFFHNSEWSKIHTSISTIPESELQISLHNIFNFLKKEFEDPSNYEYKTALLNLILKEHYSFLKANREEFDGVLLQLNEASKNKLTPLKTKMQTALALLSFVND